ncbi:hypothetical protein [Actinoplanes sp. HUAS TT8]|uniref:hypothetical protein n=1 Tax=Actinoplanes sp. HUAS TT8 TaxID=3447453 RepID=UPI003F528331
MSGEMRRLGPAASDAVLGAFARLNRYGPGGLRRARMLLVDLLGWTPEALERCVAIERDFPGWVAWYYPAEAERAEFWAATREGDQRRLLSSADVDGLRAAIASVSAAPGPTDLRANVRTPSNCL